MTSLERALHTLNQIYVDIGKAGLQLNVTKLLKSLETVVDDLIQGIKEVEVAINAPGEKEEKEKERKRVWLEIYKNAMLSPRIIQLAGKGLVSYSDLADYVLLSYEERFMKVKD